MGREAKLQGVEEKAGGKEMVASMEGTVWEAGTQNGGSGRTGWHERRFLRGGAELAPGLGPSESMPVMSVIHGWSPKAGLGRRMKCT